MFDRLGRLFRAWMGFFISMGEDPEVMLQDAIEEVRNRQAVMVQGCCSTQESS